MAEIENATPRPWRVFCASNGSLLGVGDATGGGITDNAGGLWRSGKEKKANAELIVRAVNAFDTLTAENAALKSGAGWVYFNDGSGEEYSPQHPVDTGECLGATDIRKSTAQEDCLHAAYQREWRAANSLRTMNAALRDAMDKAIAMSESARKACPIENGRGDRRKPCTICSARSSESCFPCDLANYRAIDVLRNAVASAKAAS